MPNAPQIPLDTPLWQLTVGQFLALRDAARPAVDEPKYLDEQQLFARFGLKKASADARAIPRTRIGRKSRWLVSDVEASIAATPPLTRQPKPVDLDDPFARGA